MKLIYFAWIRERIGRSDETLELPPGIVTVGDLVTWLKARGPEYGEAFARPELVRAAINQVHVKSEAPIAGAREIAFFPPVTGG
ncbi:MAG: molybdopterin converting factor subunit 1 [Hyphomicrobiaceae bacterium]